MSKWEGKTRGGSLGYLCFIYIIRYLGVSFAYILLAFVVVYFIPFAPKATSSTWFYARKILKYNRFKAFIFLFKNYYCLGQILIDKLAIRSGLKNKYQFKFEDYDNFLDILNGNQGVITIGAHIGNWEIGTPFFDKYGKKINIVMYDAEYQKVKEIIKKNTESDNFKVISINKDDLAHVFKIAEAINQKEYVCFQGDRYLKEEKCLTCSFMGMPALFPAGPFILATRLKVPVVFYFAMREKGKTYRFHFIVNKNEEIINKEKRKEQVLLESYVAKLEKILTSYPEQWFNYYKFWDINNKK